MIRYLKKYKLWCLLIAIVSLLLGSMDVFKGIILQLIVDTSVGELDYSFTFILAIIIAFTACNLAVYTLFQKSTYHVGTKAVSNIKNDIINTVIYKGQFDNEAKNMDLLSMLNKDIDIILDKYFLNIFLLLRMIMVFLLSVFYLFSINIAITFIILILGLINIILPNLFIRKSSKLKEKYSKNNSIFFNSIKELLYGLNTIKLYGAEREYYSKNSESNMQYEKSRANSLLFDSLIQVIGSCVGFLVLAANVVLAGYLSYKGYFTIGTVLAVMQIMNYVLSPLSQGPVYYAELKSVHPIIEKLKKYILPIDEYNGCDIQQKVDRVSIEDLSFKYLTGADNALSNLAFEFITPKKYIVIGSSGCGKSTLLKVLSVLESNYSGNIKINGTLNLHDIDSRSWRNKIAVVQQDVFLFDNTLKYNICMNAPVSDDKLKQIISTVGLDDFVSSLPNGIDSFIGENGSLISGGEKQRISIARALAKDSEILLVDEATSALDMQNANNVDNILLSLVDKLVIAISHRYDKSLLSRFDEIIVMDKGGIIASGKYEDIQEDETLNRLLSNPDENSNG